MYRDYDGKAITQDFINTNDMNFMINHAFKYIDDSDLYVGYLGCHLLIVYSGELIIQHIALLTPVRILFSGKGKSRRRCLTHLFRATGPQMVGYL